MQLSFDAADRLVELVQARHGPVAVDEAARRLFALASAPTAIARSLLEEVVAGDARHHLGRDLTTGYIDGEHIIRPGDVFDSRSSERSGQSSGVGAAYEDGGAGK